MKLEQAAARPALEWRLDYFTVWPHVKNLVPHHSIYGWDACRRCGSRDG